MDPWPLEAGHRPARCTGVALSTAVALFEVNFANVGGRVMLFTGGPCTVGPGQMVATDLSEPMRSHHDLEKETSNTKFVKKASKHYAAIAKRAVAAGHAVDVFACALDQVCLHAPLGHVQGPSPSRCVSALARRAPVVSASCLSDHISDACVWWVSRIDAMAGGADGDAPGTREDRRLRGDVGVLHGQHLQAILQSCLCARLVGTEPAHGLWRHARGAASSPRPRSDPSTPPRT